MRKMTVYMPDDLKAALARTAAATGCSEADLIRRSVSNLVEAYEAPAPIVPLNTGDDNLEPDLAVWVGESRREALRGFGER